MQSASHPVVALLFKRGVRRGLLTLRREPGWGTSLLALVGVILLMQLFIVVFLGVQGVGHLLGTQTELRLQVRENASERDVQEFIIAAQQLPSVSQAQYVTREQAYDRERKANPDLVQFLEQFNIRNPFPDTIAVTLRDLADYDAFATFVRQPQWRHVADSAFLSEATAREQELQQMLRLADAGKTLTLAFLSLTGGILLFVTVELVRRRVFFRRDEVSVERMSGAQEASVVLPFATEATVLLLAALILSVVLLFVLLSLLPISVPDITAGTFGALRSEIGWRLAAYGPLLFLLELLLVPVVGFVGAFLGTRGNRGSLSV